MFQEIPPNKKSRSHRKLVHGIGINNADYMTNLAIGNRQIQCPFYRVWVGMLLRCYSQKYQKLQPTYLGCSVNKKWHLFTNFKKWMILQSWQGNQLDKDLLIIGNKIYSPETCCFVSRSVNVLLTDRGSLRGNYPIGVSYSKKSGKYQASVRINGHLKHLGFYISQDVAHSKYLVAKAAHVRDVAQTQEHNIKSALFRIAEKIEMGGYYDN